METEDPQDIEENPTQNSSLLVPVVFLVLGLLVGYGVWGGGSPDSSPTFFSGPKPRYEKPVAPVAYEKPAQQQFVRLRKDGAGKMKALETALASYTPLSGADLQVDLVGAVHLADEEYFSNLNSLFRNYDVVLYELVADQNTRPTPQHLKANNPLARIQNMLPEMLGMQHQLEGVDYQAKNFVHADLSMQELIEEGKRRGETGLTLATGLALDFLRMATKLEKKAKASGQPQSLGGIAHMLSNPKVLKLSFAKALGEKEAQETLEGFTTITPYLIDMRNMRALEVLDKVIEEGNTKIAIFYGAAHLKDFEDRLLRDYALKPTNTQWMQAWDLTKEVTASPQLKNIASLIRLFSPR